MIQYSNSKINVGLFVKEKRTDGFHNIESVLYPLPLFDILEIVPADNFTFSSSGTPINEKENLVIQAFQLIKKKFAIGNVFIHLHKQIPFGTGLGGGSSNATFCLKALNELFSLNLSLKRLEELALELGSDCPFFVKNKAALVSGRGEIISPTSLNLYGLFVKVVFPGVHISTARAFEGIIPANRPLPEELEKMTNDFEGNAFKLLPELKQIKLQLMNEGAIYASLSGTGSSIFGIYNECPMVSGYYEHEYVRKLY